jgi:P pilus assembly chaperone PapD
MMQRGGFYCLMLCSLLLWGEQGRAAINLMTTRLIYPGGAPEASLRVFNDDQRPSLLQVWVDEGDAQQGPSQSKAPFLVTPPMMRLGGGKGQTLRVYGTDTKSLVQDRESLFWLNVLGLPPNAVTDGARVQLAYRTRIKLLYRPAGLPGSVREAVTRLNWQTGPGLGVTVFNPGGFYISLSEVLISHGKKPLVWQEAALIPPLGKLFLPMVGGSEAPLQGARGRVRWIDDDGNYHEQDFRLGQGAG